MTSGGVGTSPTFANGRQIWATGYVGHRPNLKRKTPSNLRRGRIVEGVVKLSSTFSNEPGVCVGDAGHGQVFSPKWPLDKGALWDR